MGAGSSVGASYPSYVTYYHQPVCEGDMPPVPAGHPDDLLKANMWDNAVNALTNFCMGTPFFKPPKKTLGTLGPRVDSYSPLCRCQEKTIGGVSQGTQLICYRYRNNRRVTYTDYCRNRCRCFRREHEAYRRLRLDASGKVANLPPDIQRLVPKPGTMSGCFGACLSPVHCRTPNLSRQCGGEQVCLANPPLDAMIPSDPNIPLDPLLWAGGTCVAAATMFVTARKHQRPGRNGKRSLAPQCYCNSTYIAESCCNSNDGIVWEDVLEDIGLKLRSDENLVEGPEVS